MMTRKQKIAVWLVVVSCAFWAGLLALPWLGAEGNTKAWIAGGLIGAGELTFWGGVLIVGGEVMKRYRDKLRPRNWFRKRTQRCEEQETVESDDKNLKG